MQRDRLNGIVDGFGSQRVAVVGDLMLDRYIWGSASRISQEAPVPVVAVKKRSSTPGGAANVLRNIASLGAQPVAFGVLGADASGDELVALLSNHNVATSGVLRDSNRITAEKTRIIADHQQVVRVDNERIEAISEEDADALLARLREGLEQDRLDAIVVEDYGKGTVTEPLLQGVSALGSEFGCPVALDPHPGNPARTSGLTVMTPNRSEAFAMAGAYPHASVMPVEDDAALMDVVTRLQREWVPTYLMITLGGDGMALFEEGQAVHHIPTRAREVFDVSGAGDTVIASFLLSLLAGATADEAAEISNHAAGVVVAKVGTATVSAEELIAAFEQDAV